MKSPSYKVSVIVVAAVVASSLLLGGCGEGLKGSDIYGASLGGALIGGIIGYQSDETEEGVALGAALFGVGELLSQMDKPKDKEHRDDGNDDGCKEVYVIQVHNSNGSITPINVEKKGNTYIGPKGEHYEQLPTEEQLKPVYGF